MTSHGGRRPGAGQPPRAGTRQTERKELKLTEGQLAEIEAAIPEGESFNAWVVEAALMRARRGE